MYVISTPAPYGSIFRSPVFRFGDATSASGIDFSVNVSGVSNTVNTKRLYPSGTASVNAAPYLRGQLRIEPLTAYSMNIGFVNSRIARCRVTADGIASPQVPLTGGTEDATPFKVLSAAPEKSVLRPGECDEIAFITGAGYVVKPFVSMRYGNALSTYSGLMPVTGDGVIAMPVVMSEVDKLFTQTTGKAAENLVEFTVSLRITPSGGGSDLYLQRFYKVDRNSVGGVRLAWVNRYGSVDYHTFPESRGVVFEGNRTRIQTPDGPRTVATAAKCTETFASGPCDPATAEWLAEIFSSPAVWKVSEGVSGGSGGSGSSGNGALNTFERIEIAGGKVECPPEKPSKIVVQIAPETSTPSRKF